MILGEDFRFRDEYDLDTVPIELLTGKYKGVIFRYLNVQITEDIEGDVARIGFHYDILETPYDEKEMTENPLFKENLGLILNQLILDVTEYDANANRESNLEESYETREVRSDGSTVSEG